MIDLSNLRVAVLATDGFEESEMTEPVRVLGEAGAQVEIIAPHEGQIQAFRHFDKGITVKVDRSLRNTRSTDYDCALVAGRGLECRRALRGPASGNTSRNSSKPASRLPSSATVPGYWCRQTWSAVGR